MSVGMIIEGRIRELGGGFSVERVLPFARRRTVGPFIFFDHMGPVAFAPGEGLDVRPHPHIGLATVTYLFEGEILHRDSLGSVQAIRPGDVNWMVAGRGITHSERTSTENRAAGMKLHGIQAWVAMPHEAEETAPTFDHHSADSLPMAAIAGAKVRLIAGEAFGVRSPVTIHSPLFYADAEMDAGATIELPADFAERGAYIVTGSVESEGSSYGAGRLLVFEPGSPARIRAEGPVRAMLLGGAALDGERHIWWNFVSSSAARIEQAKADWLEGRFPAVPGETEFIPLPQA